MKLSDTYTVYMHTCPNGKRYVGMTSNTLTARFGYEGKGYTNNPPFWKDIKNFGWSNITHAVVASGLSKDDAAELEIALIHKYNTMDPEFGYNRSDIPYTHTQSSRYRLSCTLKGHPVSDYTKLKMRLARLQNPVKCPWNRGLTKETDRRVFKLSEKQRGRVVSESTRQKLSDSHLKLHASGYEPVWVHNDTSETLVDQSKLQAYLDSGYIIGRLNIKDTYVSRDGTTVKINHSDLDIYLNDGWEAGTTDKWKSHIKESRRLCYWKLDDMVFETSESLASYLRQHGYPSIVSSTITSLIRNGFEKTTKYKPLEGHISRVMK